MRLTGRLTGLSNMPYLKEISQKKKSYLVPLSVEVFTNDVKVRFHGKPPENVERTRGQVQELSYKSLRRLAFVASNTSIEFQSILTLTYPAHFPSDGKTVKRHLNNFLTSARARYLGLSYLWFMEFQKRGAPHVHILMSVKVTRNEQKWVSRRWFKCCKSGDDKHLKAGTNFENVRQKDGAKRYAVKYAMKPYQKIVPDTFGNVGRFWGHSKDVKPVMLADIPLRYPTHLDKLLHGWAYQETCSPDLSVRYNSATIVIQNVDKW